MNTPPVATGDRGFYWIHGRLVPKESAAISVGDLAFTRGYAAFEALRTYAGRPFLLDAHLDRLRETCFHLGLRLPDDYPDLPSVISAVLRANAFPESLLRIFVTGGETPGFTPVGTERLLVLVDPLREYPDSLYARGLAIATSRLQRSFPEAKSTDYLVGVRETVRARAQGNDEVVFLDAAGRVLEGTTFNVVMVKGRELVAPQEGVLRGLTLEHTLSLAKEANLSVRRASFTIDELLRADEVFITSSTREIMPIDRIDGLKAGADPLRRVTHELQARFRASALRLCCAELSPRAIPAP